MQPGVDALETASELRVVIGRLVRRLRAEYSFPVSHVAVLSRLEREGPRTTSALALAERMRPQSMAQALAELSGDGLVERLPDPDDRRQTLIQLTAAGREALARERARREGWLAAAIESELNLNEQRALARAVPLLGRLADV